jgi:fused signal recognition particle receptor
MASIFGFFKRKPRADAPAVTPSPPADAPSATTSGADAPVAATISTETTVTYGPSGERITAPVPAEAIVPEPAAVPETTRSAAIVVAEHPAESVATIDLDVAESLPAGWFSRLKLGLDKTRQQLGGRLVGVFGAGRKLDEAFYEELETVLLTSDVGVSATEFLLDNLRARARREGYTEAEQLKEALGDLLLDLLSPLARPLDVSAARPFVIMLAGVNGSGKTTSIGKLARYYQRQGKKILLAAGDTFRAAAREQLMAWGERNNVTVVTQQSGDAAAVIFDAVNAAAARGIDVVLADTAGRLPTQLHLMDEIKKVKRVVAKALPGAPHEVLLVLDANTGQNALTQVKAFDDALGVTGLVMTKLDGTAKGGVIAGIAHTRAKGASGPIPLRFIGVGEGIDDLRPFDAEDFVAALLGDDEA